MVSNSCVQFEDGAVIKFLCSYGGKILPRQTDGKLRYFGGDTRVLAVDRSITFKELMVKLGELCGTTSVSLRCQLPLEDLDALVSITCDEDLANIVEEYDRANRKAAASPLKIRAFLWPQKSKRVSPPPSTSPPSPLSPSVRSFLPFSPAVRFIRTTNGNVSGRYVHQMSKPMKYPIYGSRLGPYACLPQRNPLRHSHSHTYLGNHWQ